MNDTPPIHPEVKAIFAKARQDALKWLDDRMQETHTPEVQVMLKGAGLTTEEMRESISRLKDILSGNSKPRHSKGNTP